MIEFYSTQQSQAIDRFATNQPHLSGLLLMKRAGLFSFETLINHYPNAQNLLILCGTGNNGGDGFVVAQLAMMRGLNVDVLLNGPLSQLTDNTRLNYQTFVQMGGQLSNPDMSHLNAYDLIIDALLGTGLNKQRPLNDKLIHWFELINQQAVPVMALDIPSGLDANTGQVHGCALKAERTCTFLTQKLGLYQFNGHDTAGQIHYSRLFLNDQALHSQTPIAYNHMLKHWLNQLPKRKATSHKGSAGQVVLVGGDRHMMGAVQMAGLASLKVGTGLVKVITHPEHGVALTQVLPELMCYSPNSASIALQNTHVLAIGPGLGLNEWGQSLFEQTIHRPENKVVDADALTLLAQTPFKQTNWVLTPHPGEAARLLNTSTQTIQNDRISAIKSIQKKYGGVVVLKGNASLIYDGQQMEVCLAGNPGMAVGGMGDVLTGTISGLMAQNMPPFVAACLGVSLHAHAGDILAQQKGQNGILPTELAAVLSQLLTYSNR